MESCSGQHGDGRAAPLASLDTPKPEPHAMKRRTMLLSAAAVALSRPSIAAPSTALRYVPNAPLTVLDPVFSTANGTINHGYHVFDTLYAVDSAFRPHPQMAAGHTVSDDGL